MVKTKIVNTSFTLKKSTLIFDINCLLQSFNANSIGIYIYFVDDRFALVDLSANIVNKFFAQTAFLEILGSKKRYQVLAFGRGRVVEIGERGTVVVVGKLAFKSFKSVAKEGNHILDDVGQNRSNQIEVMQLLPIVIDLRHFQFEWMQRSSREGDGRQKCRRNADHVSGSRNNQ